MDIGLQVQGEDKSMVIKDLFKEIDYNDFPDQVNEPTLARLNEFLEGASRPPAKRLTVRTLVQRMLKISVPPTCQCWQMFNSQCMANVDHLSDEQRRTKRVLELQRVVVNCSRGVFGIMQEAYQEWETLEMAGGEQASKQGVIRSSLS